MGTFAADFGSFIDRNIAMKNFISKAYYLKAPTDPPFEKIDAIRSIKFEITDENS